MTKSVHDRFIELQKFYAARCTRDIQFRIDSLTHLLVNIEGHSDEISTALKSDLGKSLEESYITEISFVTAEIRHQIKHLRRWARDRKVGSPITIFPSRSRIIYEPKGVVLIMAPWNYPFHLAMAPLVGAIAAGNCVAVKPSTTSSATCAIIAELIKETFPESFVTVFDGDHAQAAELLACPFDHIFFTGGASFGRTVMAEAAKNLTPVTLELGGKSPCIVDHDANIEIAARRIVWGKLTNAGQTCIAPDYILVHESVKDELIERMTEVISEYYGDDIKSSPHYPRIISDKAFDRLTSYLRQGNILYGGDYDKSERYIQPTIIDNVTDEMPIMQEEIFGPIFPVISFPVIEAAITYVNARPKPLAMYYFGRKRKGRWVLGLTTSGGACINDTLVHIANPKIPFGGVGMSGMGGYHGRWSFETFSNAKSTVISRIRIDVPLRYPPYKGFKFLKKII